MNQSQQRSNSKISWVWLGLVVQGNGLLSNGMAFALQHWPPFAVAHGPAGEGAEHEGDDAASKAKEEQGRVDWVAEKRQCKRKHPFFPYNFMFILLVIFTLFS